MHRQNDINKHIYIIVKVFAVLFAVIFLNLSYIQVYEAEALLNNPHNSHVMEKASEIQRGKIMDNSGVILADTQKEKIPLNAFIRTVRFLHRRSVMSVINSAIPVLKLRKMPSLPEIICSFMHLTAVAVV